MFAKVGLEIYEADPVVCALVEDHVCFDDSANLHPWQLLFDALSQQLRHLMIFLEGDSHLVEGNQTHSGYLAWLP